MKAALSRRPALLAPLAALALLTACEPGTHPELAGGTFTATGRVANPALDEISGLQASRRHPGVLWVHNDDGPPRLHALDETGQDLGWLDLEGAQNRDWEDLTLVPGAGHDWLVVADSGDNQQQRGDVVFWWIAEPRDRPAGGALPAAGPARSMRWTWPRTALDCEAVAWDAAGQRLLLISKREQPPGLYAAELDGRLEPLGEQLRFLGPVTGLRKPEGADLDIFGGHAPFVSQPTGWSIAADGRQAAIITYRSLYLYQRPEGMDWADVLAGTPVEFIGPPLHHEEAISHAGAGRRLWITSEGKQPVVFAFDPDPPRGER